MIDTKETEGELLSEEIEGEILSDEALQAKQKKAEMYASQPERITPLSLEFEVKAEHGNRLVTYSDDGEWTCVCDFFQQHQTCSHVMAVGRVLKHLPITQPRGNLEETWIAALLGMIAAISRSMVRKSTSLFNRT